jgi:hypothetical protein
MKDPDFAEQHNGNPTTSPLADLCSKLQKQSFDVAPWQAATDRPSEDQLKGALVLALHTNHGTAGQYRRRLQIPGFHKYG